jgi:hypothetical protein
MGIYSDESVILGVRILTSKTGNHDEFFVEYEFTGTNWKRNALLVMPSYIGQSNVKIQTLHPFSTSYNLHSGSVMNPGNIWLNNTHFSLKDLY